MSAVRAARPRRILYVNHVSALGGAEESLLETLRALDRARFEPLAVLPGPGPLAARLASESVPVFSLPLRRFRKTRNPLSLLAAAVNILSVAVRLARLVRHERIELIHANSATAHLYGGLAAGWAGIPCLWHCRDLADLGRLEPWLVKKASAVIAISGTVFRHLQRKDASLKVTVIPNAIDAGRFEQAARGSAVRSELGLEPGHFVVGMAGQMVPWKKHDLFLRMAARLTADLPEARFLVAGGNLFGTDTAYEARIRALAGELGLGGKVVFTGHRSDMPAVLAALDVLVHPADREPLGRVILEALALGKPVVAVEGAGPAEILAGGAGLLVPPGHAGALADAVLGLRRDPAGAAALGRAGRARVDTLYSPASHVSEIETLYAGLLPARPVVAMVTAEFPSLSETFILREMRALEGLGLRIVPVALRRPAPGPVHADAAAFLGRARYPSRSGIAAALGFYGMTAPRRLFGLLLEAVLRGDPAMGSRAKALYRAGLAAEAARRVRGCRVDRVHAHFAWVTAEVGRGMARLLGVPFSVSAHAWDLYAQPPRALAARVAGADFVAVCTGQGRARIREAAPDFPDDRLVLVRHGVFPERYEGTTAPSPRILAVGRLEEKKGFCFLVEACRLLKERGTVFDCVIAGEGSLRFDLARRIREAGLDDRVRLAGPQTQEQLLEWYGTAMVMAVPSVVTAEGDRDGVPNVILEAMAMRIPVVASAAGAIPEAVADGVQGLLVPPGDAEALAGALAWLLAEAETRRRMGERGRETVGRDFDAVRNAEVLAGLFGKH